MKHNRPELSTESAVAERVAGFEMRIEISDKKREDAQLEFSRADALAAWLMNEWLRGHSEGGGS